jgi:hypothetical protein
VGSSQRLSNAKTWASVSKISVLMQDADGGVLSGCGYQVIRYGHSVVTGGDLALARARAVPLAA